MLMLFFILLFAFFLTGCDSPPSVSNNVPQQPVKDSIPSPRLDLDDADAPYISNESLKLAWDQFIRDGRYRIARLSDMRFSDQTKNRLLALNLRWWKSQHSTEHGLAVIIVDTTRTDDDRFGLVVFRPGYRTKSDAYTPYWLYRNRDLSRAAIKQISSTLTVYEIEENGYYRYCDIAWDERRKGYICRQYG
jgi:hypothetical protein